MDVVAEETRSRSDATIPGCTVQLFLSFLSLFLLSCHVTGCKVKAEKVIKVVCHETEKSEENNMLSPLFTELCFNWLKTFLYFA